MTTGMHCNNSNYVHMHLHLNCAQSAAVVATVNEVGKDNGEGEEEYLAIVNSHKKANSKENPTGFGSANIQEQELLSSPPGEPDMAMCMVYTNEQVANIL